MERRWPQPVRVGDLFGLSLLDWNDRTLARIHALERTSAAKIRLIVDQVRWLGLVRRRVAIPMEVVAIAGRQLALIDIPRDEFFRLPEWSPAPAGSGSSLMAADEMTRIALYKR